MDVFFLKLFLEKPFKQHLSLIRTFEIRIFEKSKQTESSSRGRSEVKGAVCFKNFIFECKENQKTDFYATKNKSPEPRKKNQESVSFVDFFNGNLRFFFVHFHWILEVNKLYNQNRSSMTYLNNQTFFFILLN